MIHIGLRLDDPSTTSLHSLERKILVLLKSNDLPATFAVIPFRHGKGLQAAQIPHLLEADRSGHIEIALHGHGHEPLGQTGSGHPSEFANRPADAQEVDIRSGKKRLEKVFGVGRVKGFVPPWNTFDETTETILHRLGFRYLSAGSRLPAGVHPKAVPRTCHIAELDAAIAEARRAAWGDAYIVALMHHYDFHESGETKASIDIPWLRACLERHGQAPNIRFVTLGELAQVLPATLLTFQRHRHRIPWPIQKRLPRLCLAWPHPRILFDQQ